MTIIKVFHTVNVYAMTMRVNAPEANVRIFSGDHDRSAAEASGNACVQYAISLMLKNMKELWHSCDSAIELRDRALDGHVQ